MQQSSENDPSSTAAWLIAALTTPDRLTLTTVIEPLFSRLGHFSLEVSCRSKIRQESQRPRKASSHSGRLVCHLVSKRLGLEDHRSLPHHLFTTEHALLLMRLAPGSRAEWVLIMHWCRSSTRKDGQAEVDVRQASEIHHPSICPPHAPVPPALNPPGCLQDWFPRHSASTIMLLLCNNICLFPRSL